MNKKPVTPAPAAGSVGSVRYTPKPKGSWLKLFGRAKNDELSTEAYRQGAEWRDRMNREGH